MHGKLSKEEMDSMLRHEFLGRIGCHSNGMTYIVPISYAFDGKYLFCHSQEGMKIDMLRKNPEVCFEIDKLDSLAAWKSIIIWGKYEEVENEEERNKALKILLNRAYPFIVTEKMKLGSDWPFTSDNLSLIKGVVFRINIKEMSGRYDQND
jgi:uncharacterized protein